MRELTQAFWNEAPEIMFHKIEEIGGWPKDKPFLAFYHGDMPRECEFFAHEVRSEWWTTYLTRDEYLWWQLSPKFKTKRFDEVIAAFENRIQRLVP